MPIGGGQAPDREVGELAAAAPLYRRLWAGDSVEIGRKVHQLRLGARGKNKPACPGEQCRRLRGREVWEGLAVFGIRWHKGTSKRQGADPVVCGVVGEVQQG